MGQVAKALGLEADGYRVLMNMGMHAGQEVPHFHEMARGFVEDSVEHVGGVLT